MQQARYESQIRPGKQVRCSTAPGKLIFVLILCLFVPHGLWADSSKIAAAEQLIKEGYEAGSIFLQGDSKKARNKAKKCLSEAEKILKKEIKRNRSCEACFTGLARTYFYQSYFGFEKNYGDCFKVLEQGREQFPENTRLALIEGYASHNSRQWERAIKALKEFLLFASGQPEIENSARRYLESSQQYFLNGWYRYNDFYGSKEARFTVLNPNTFRQDTVFEITPQWELQLGQSAFQQITSQGNIIQDLELQRYLERLVGRMVEKTPGPFQTYQVAVVDSPAVNAVTTPGKVIVFTGLIQFVENEAELVGVLAHELAHNYGHHSGRRFLQTLKAQTLANSILKEINPQSFQGRFIGEFTSKVAIELFVRAYTRSEEKQADHYGAHIAFNAGYDPTALSTAFLKMYKANPKQGIGFLRTHPAMPDRIEYITEYLENFPLENEMRNDSEEFQEIKARLFPQERRRLQPPGKAVIPPPSM